MKKNVILLVVTTLLVIGCKKESKYQKVHDKPLPVRIAVVADNDNASVRNYIGEISSGSEMPLSFILGGELTELNIKKGQFVHKGDVLARVDATQAKSMYESAKAVLQQAEDGYNRTKPVHDKGGISELRWKEIETDVQKARSMFVSAEKRYLDCTLRASMDGYVQMNNVEVGQTLGPSQRIGMLLDMKSLTAKFTVPENEVGNLAIGQHITVLIPSLDIELPAPISEKDIVSTHLAHTYQVTATLPDNEVSRQLLPGMVCKAQVTNLNKGGIVVPASCVVTQKQGLSVWVISNGKAERRLIKMSEYVKNGVIVDDGLSNGDTIVVQGYQKLYNGANIAVIE